MKPLWKVGGMLGGVLGVWAALMVGETRSLSAQEARPIQLKHGDGLQASNPYVLGDEDRDGDEDEDEDEDGDGDGDGDDSCQICPNLSVEACIKLVTQECPEVCKKDNKQREAQGKPKQDCDKEVCLKSVIQMSCNKICTTCAESQKDEGDEGDEDDEDEDGASLASLRFQKTP